MGCWVRNFQSNFNKWISLHDRKVTKIECKESSVVFMFDNGFDLIDGEKCINVKSGYVEIENCTSNDFRCYVIERQTSPSGAIFNGKPMSLSELSKLISKERTLELHVELYDSDYMHFRGAFFPYEGHSLSTIVVIETNDFFQMNYYWN